MLKRLTRKLLFLLVLCAPLLAVPSPPAGATCPDWEMCGNMYRSCMYWCHGDPYCESYCKQDYNDCICSNCGACPPGGLP